MNSDTGVPLSDPTPATAAPFLNSALPRTPVVVANAGAIVHLEGAPGGGDPLVTAYANRFRATCAMRTFSWGWLLLGIVAAIIGGMALGALVGPEFILDKDRPAFAHLANRLMGNPWAVLAGMATAAFITSTLGVVLNRKSVPCGQEPWIGFLVAVMIYLPIYDPLVALGVIGGTLTLVYVVTISFRLLAMVLGGKRGIHHDVLAEPAAGWPVYTVLVPLYKERNVARNILVSLNKLDYPHDKLDVKFLLEADDPETLQALKEAGIPAYAEVLVVPMGQPKTKPRACNHGLERARGKFLVIFDAEDRPEPDQLKQAVLAFCECDKKVVCLQAQLAYHNHRQTY
jgi:hypothetical protein